MLAYRLHQHLGMLAARKHCCQQEERCQNNSQGFSMSASTPSQPRVQHPSCSPGELQILDEVLKAKGGAG